jgi:hypothetical protein
MNRSCSSSSSARLSRILVAVTFLLVIGIALLAIPTALPVYASSKFLDQCANGDINPMACSWVTGIVGNANSHYIEGMAVPQRELMYGIDDCDPVTHVCVYSFSVTWNDALVHGYDMLVSWDMARTINIAKTGVSDFYLNPCQGYNNTQETACTSAYTHTTGTTGSFIDVEVPNDPFKSGSFTYTSTAQSRINALEGLYGNRFVRLYANDVITAASLQLTHCNANLSVCNLADGTDTSTGTSVISYTLTYTTNATNALFTFAGHLAEGGNPYLNPLSWGYQNGAGETGGANWHVKDPKFNYVGGSQDNQLALSEHNAFPMNSWPSQTVVSTVSGITDTLVMTSDLGTSAINGTIHFYVCGDVTVPYDALANGCLSTKNGSDYKVIDLGTSPLTNNSTNPPSSQTVSASFTPAGPGRYCFLSVYTPSGTAPYPYSVISDTSSAECFTYSGPTAVRLNSLNASSDDTLLSQMNSPLAFVGIGMLTLLGAVVVWKLASRHK